MSQVHEVVFMHFYVSQRAVPNIFYHFIFYKNVYGTWLSMTLEANRIDSTIYNFTVYLKCLYPIPFFFPQEKMLTIPVLYYGNSQ